MPWKAESSQDLDSHLLLASLCFSDDQLKTSPWSLRAGTKEPAELLSCAAILELWGFYCHSFVTSVVQNLIVISSGCLGRIIFTLSVSDEETGLLRAQLTCLKPHYGTAGLRAVLPGETSLSFLPDHVLFALLPIGLQKHLLLVTSS